MNIEDRKYEHIHISKMKDVEYKKTTGFEDINFLHCALPELDYNDVDISTRFLGKKIEAPIIMEAITGGYQKAKKINKHLAKASQNNGTALGLGSMRPMIENPKLKNTYIVRDVAPDTPLITNIGIAQAIEYSSDILEDAIISLDADALAIHLNPAQEIVQTEGDKKFNNGLKAIERLCKELSYPIIVKEVGAGINAKIAKKLSKAGASLIDVAGAGGTSWTKIEYHRCNNVVPGFEEWGIPTVLSLLMCRKYSPLIASGGIRSGLDVAKSLALGAQYAGAALPFIKDDPDKILKLWKKQLKTVLFLTGSKNLRELNHKKIYLNGTTLEMKKQLNL